MNNSGLAAMEIIRFYKIELCNLIVFHDDLDISLGKIRPKMMVDMLVIMVRRYTSIWVPLQPSAICIGHPGSKI